MLNFILSSKYSLLYPIAVGSLNCTLSARVHITALPGVDASNYTLSVDTLNCTLPMGTLIMPILQTRKLRYGWINDTAGSWDE